MATGVEDLDGLLSEAENTKSDTDVAGVPIKRPVSLVLPLLLEVGCEEIPARFLRDAEKALGARVLAALEEARLLPSAGRSKSSKSPAQTFSTPRRLVVHVAKVLVQQPDKVEELQGPPVKVAVDAEGKYTRAAESFAQKNDVALEDFFRVDTPKGEYLAVRKTTPGRTAAAILAEVLPAAILGLSFPKSMYWTAKSDARFVRPIRWVVALLGAGKEAKTVNFEILGVKSGNYTFGHRTRGSQPITVTGFSNYARKLSQALVEIDYNVRLDRVVQNAQTVLGETPGTIVQNVWLLDWIANATEWPLPMLGSFDERFLHLPREILITVMRDHQRYFAVEDEQGNLRPHFVAVLNMDADAKGLIRQGHQRVLTARFRDAEFFWNADQKVLLRDRRALLDKVTYQARLGSYGAKIQRTKAISEYICAILEGKNVESGLSPAPSSLPELTPALPSSPDAALKGGSTPGFRQHVLRAVELCKCDLTAQMVREFTELQGIVGGLYAKVQGEPEEVATAIYDHYLPAGAEGESPRTLVGVLVSLADKFDSVVAGFAAGYEPTGSSDPYALRRQANGIIKVILENSIPLSLMETVKSALDALENQFAKSAEASAAISPQSPAPSPILKWRKPREEVQVRVLEFFAERLRYYLESVRGFRYDTVRAVVAAGADAPADAQARAEAMEALRGGEDFEALSVAAKRIRNILAKSASSSDWQAGEIDSSLLSDAEEIELSQAYARVATEARSFGEAHDYRKALEAISALRPAVDRFFDKVLVMAEDRAVRQNRLRLLKKLDELFSGIAHFAEIAEKQ